VTSTEDTVESQVNSARDERDRLALWSRVLPITFTAVGLIALIGGALLASFSLRTESALAAPDRDLDDQEFGRAEERVPGAEAETEKLPTQRPRDDPSPPGADRPEPGSGESTPPDPEPPEPSSSGPPERD
jgi:hypothetical protein